MMIPPDAGSVRKGFRPGKTAWLSIMMVLMLGGWLMAQSPRPSGAPAAAPAAPGASNTGDASLPSGLTFDPQTGKTPSLPQLFNTSPVINSIIVALSVAAVAMFVAFMLMINTGRMMPPDFVDDVTKLVVVKKFNEAAEYCRNNKHIFAASIIQRCVENSGKDHTTLLQIIDAEGRRRADLVWNRISYLLDLSNVAPMLGLLGTVLGMIEAFFTQSGPTSGIRSRALMGAIGGAMTATFFGLIVAIMAVVFYTFLKSRTTKTLGEVEQVVHSIADHMKRGAV